MKSDRTELIRRTLWIVLILNLLVTLIKLTLGLLSGALSVVADGMQSLVDSASNVIGLIGMWASARPPDDNHPYGHHKYETLAALSIGALSLLAVYEIGKSILERALGSGALIEITPLTIGLMAGTFIVNLGVTIYETRLGQRLQSQVLLADAAQTRANLLVTLSVIASLIGARFGFGWFDSAAALIVMGVILRSTFAIWLDTSKILTDVITANPSDIERIALTVPHVHHVDHVRSRGLASAMYVDLHVEVPPLMAAEQAHSIASEVERRLAEQIPGVVDAVVHVEPARPEAPLSVWQELSLTLRNLADGMGLGLHDLHAHVEPDGGYSIELHLELTDAQLTLREAHARADDFEQRARERLPAVRSLTTHLEPLPTGLQNEADSATDFNQIRGRIIQRVDKIAGRGACHAVQIHNINSHLTATLHITQPALQMLRQSHALAEKVERAIHAHEPRLDRVVVHIEPPDQDC